MSHELIAVDKVVLAEQVAELRTVIARICCVVKQARLVTSLTGA